MKKRAHASPWIAQLQKNHTSTALSNDCKTDITIIGGGIAGIATAYYLLRDTKHHVTIIEAYKIAHGATGHNAGQIVSYFEKPFKQLAKEFGLKKAAAGQHDILSAWDLLNEIYDETGIQVPFYQFIGYAGCTSPKQVLLHLENMHLMKRAGIAMESVLISDAAHYKKKIPKKYKNHYTIIPHDTLLSILETSDTQYTAALTSRKGCLNSALFCEELLKYLQRTYKRRITVYEHTPVQSVHLLSKQALILAKDHILTSKKVILCTNGFENLHIINQKGKDVDRRFHDNITGVVGYMKGYFGDPGKCPAAISYFTKHAKTSEDQYVYMTKRYYEYNKKTHILLCVGGPDMILKDTTTYHPKNNYLPKAGPLLDTFLRNQYPHVNHLKEKFNWHGLMGYTKNGVRCIGEEKRNKVLLYNLGCNGVGILPSIYGGKKISLIIQKKKQKPSIFDP